MRGIKSIVVPKDGYLSLEEFKDLIDIVKVKHYSIKVNKDKMLTIKFYDKKKKLIRPNKLDENNENREDS